MPSASDTVDDQLRDIIDNFYQLMIKSYDYSGPNSGNGMVNEIKRLITNLTALQNNTRNLPTAAPDDLIEYIEQGRNPDIYNREFVETLMRNNMLLKGKSEAFGTLRDNLAREIRRSVPELTMDVDMVVGSRATANGDDGGRFNG